MKISNAFINTFLFGILISLASFTFSSNASDYEIPKNGISSISDFDQLINHDIFPFNKLSETTRKSFVESLVFNEKGELGSAKFVDIQNELSETEQKLFWNTLFGGNVIFINSEADLNKSESNGVAPCDRRDIVVWWNYRNADLYSCFPSQGFICKFCNV